MWRRSIGVAGSRTQLSRRASFATISCLAPSVVPLLHHQIPSFSIHSRTYSAQPASQTAIKPKESDATQQSLDSTVNAASVSQILDLLRSDKLSEALRLADEVRLSTEFIDSQTSSALLEAYAKAGNLANIDLVLRRICATKRNGLDRELIAKYNVDLGELGNWATREIDSKNWRDRHEVSISRRELESERLRKHMLPSDHALIKTLNACHGRYSTGIVRMIRSLVYEQNAAQIPLLNAMMRAFLRLKDPLAALNTYTTNAKRSVGRMDSETHGLLIRAYGKAGKYDYVAKQWRRVFAAKVPLTNTLCASYIAACGDVNKPEKAAAALQAMEKQERGLPLPDIHVYTAVARNILRTDVDGVWSVIRQMKAKGIQPSVHIYSAILEAYIRSNRAAECSAVLARMKADGVEPNLDIYRLVIGVAADEANADKAIALYEAMQRKQIRPDVKVYAHLLNACDKQGKKQAGSEELHKSQAYLEMLEKAAEVVKKMDEIGLVADTAVYGYLVRMHTTANKPNTAYALYSQMKKLGHRATFSTHADVHGLTVSQFDAATA